MPGDSPRQRQEQSRQTPMLRLRAEDAEDIAIIAACLQDAVLQRRQMTFLPKQRRFAMVVSRHCWEDEAKQGERGRKFGRRVVTGVHFDGVLKAETLGFGRDAPDMLELLTIAVEPGEDAAATLLLMFAGGPLVRLTVECIDAELSDIGPSWATPWRPRHAIDNGDAAPDGSP
ncbi:MAG TPA: DUF2948 family protein [Candidatus Cybelea sp.]|nr:DUF2948 family protein [Candidatus Cybelea sp.]